MRAPKRGEKFRLDRQMRHLVYLLACRNNPKMIAGAMHIAYQTVCSKINLLHHLVDVNDAAEMLDWIMQNPEAMDEASELTPGLHHTGCSCDKPSCLFDRLVAIKLVQEQERARKAGREAWESGARLKYRTRKADMA